MVNFIVNLKEKQAFKSKSNFMPMVGPKRSIVASNLFEVNTLSCTLHKLGVTYGQRGKWVVIGQSTSSLIVNCTPYISVKINSLLHLNKHDVHKNISALN